MLGHYLLTLTSEQEDRVLTQPLHPGNGLAWNDSKLQCIVAATVAAHSGFACLGYYAVREIPRFPIANALAGRYDALCNRFGAPRVNAAIRNRILANRAWRTLQTAPALCA